MKYMKVKQETEQWDKFHRYWNQDKRWIEKEKQIEEFLGCPIMKNLKLSTTQLIMSKPPEHLRDQFSKNLERNGYYAKKNSKINKQWINFVKENQLDSYGMTALLIETGLALTKAKQLDNPMFGEYFIHWNDDKTPDYDWLEEVNEPDFLRLLADWKEQQNMEVVA